MFTSESDMLIDSAPNISMGLGRKISSDEEDYLTQKDYKETIEQCLIRWWEQADIVTRADYASYKEEINDHNLGDFGMKVLDIPYGLANYLAYEYGWEAFSDRDFLMYLQKVVGQTYLAKV